MSYDFYHNTEVDIVARQENWVKTDNHFLQLSLVKSGPLDTFTTRLN